MSFDGEGGHWYTESGEPCYSIIGKNGNERAVWITDAIRLRLKPSVTTVLQVIDKPALTNWLIDQGIMAALTGTRRHVYLGPASADYIPPPGAFSVVVGQDGVPGWSTYESDEDYIARIKVDGRAQAKAAAEEGTRIHDAIEKSFTGLDFSDAYNDHVESTHAELERLFPDVTDWISEKSFSHPLGYGGKVDLHSPSTGIVVDFKTKDGDFSDGKRLAYDQNIQLAAYQIGLGLTVCPDGGDFRCFTQCANIFVSRTHPGKVASHVWSSDEIADGWRTFECALALWKQLKKYDASW